MVCRCIVWLKKWNENRWNETPNRPKKLVVSTGWTFQIANSQLNIDESSWKINIKKTAKRHHKNFSQSSAPCHARNDSRTSRSSGSAHSSRINPHDIRSARLQHVFQRPDTQAWPSKPHCSKSPSEQFSGPKALGSPSHMERRSHWSHWSRTVRPARRRRRSCYHLSPQ